MVLYFSNSAKDTQYLAKKIAEIMKRGSVIAFEGDLGSGKTTFIQGMCQNWDIKEYVNSPTFTLINEYNAGEDLKIYHLDCYRIEDSSELEELGYEEFFYSDDIVFIEWSENVKDLFPDDLIVIKLKYIGEDKREIVIKGDSEFENKINVIIEELEK